MANILVYSKVNNDVTMSSFEHRKDHNGKVVQSIPINEVTIKGLTNWLRENNKRFVYAGEVAETMVDKDLWDKIVAERGTGDPLLVNGLIYTAKSGVEAKAILKDAPSCISDLGTDETLNKKPKEKKLI